MKIFKFYPAKFERMYFVAENIDHAKSMVDILFEKYMEPKDWYDEDELPEIKERFLEGFSYVEEDDLAFIDWHY